MSGLTLRLKKEYLALAIVLLATFVFRFPSMFEPFWYGDEGIFAAVASNLNQGGVLYRDAWDNKPPMIYLTYAFIFKTFGVSMFALRLFTIIVVLTTTTIIYKIGELVLDRRRAIIAAFLFGLITSLRLIEGNLALTEIFMILPISAAMLIAISRKFDGISLFIAGFLFATASLFKQVGAFEAGALGIFLLLNADNFWSFFKKGLALTFGFVIPYAITVGYFKWMGLLSDYIFGAYTYYRIYLGESPKYAALINIFKFLPIISAIVYGLFKRGIFRDFSISKLVRIFSETKKVEVYHLLLLWAAFSFLGSYFSGRTYGHYLVQATPSVSLLFASLTPKLKIQRVQLIFGLFFLVPIVFLTNILFSNFLSAGPINQIKYWNNFISFAKGSKSQDDYHNYFDSNLRTFYGVSDYFVGHNAVGRSAYIWGDMSWLYAHLDLRNPSRYVTSFHVFGVPNGKEEVYQALVKNPPEYIIRMDTNIGYFSDLEKLLIQRYTLDSRIESAQIYTLSR